MLLRTENTGFGEHATVILSPVCSDIHCHKFIFCIHYCMNVYGEVGFIFIKLRTGVCGHLMRTCFPSIAPTQLGKFHCISNSSAISCSTFSVTKGMCRFTSLYQMASHVSYTVSAIVLCAILAENDKDLKLIPVERN